MRSVVLVALLALMVAGCGGSESSPTAAPTSPGATAGAGEPGAIAVDSATLSGTGSKTGPATDLSGDYVLTTKVKGKSGCAWSVGFEGESPLIDLTTSSGTTHQTTVSLTGLFAASYRIVVKSSKCGAWSVGLKRP